MTFPEAYSFRVLEGLKMCVCFSSGTCHVQSWTVRLLIFVCFCILFLETSTVANFPDLSPSRDLILPYANQGQKSNLKNSWGCNVQTTPLDLIPHYCLAASLKGIQTFPWSLFCCSLIQEKEEQSWTVPGSCSLCTAACVLLARLL